MAKRPLKQAEKDQLTVMDETLREARDEIRELEGMVMQLTAPPLRHATVLRGGREAADLRFFKVGDRVLIRSDSEYVGQCNAEGTVTHEEAGFATVQFDNGYENGYRANINPQDDPHGGGEVDLEFVKPLFNTATVMMGGSHSEVMLPEGDVVRPGDVVLVNGQGSITGKFGEELVNGPILTVNAVHGEHAELDHDGRTLLVMQGLCRDVKPGHRVVLDSSGQVILKDLGPQEDSGFAVEHDTGVRWDDIGGLEEAKQQIRLSIEMPHLHRDVFEHYSKKPAKGFLLYGAPGCGKTMLGKAAASALQDLHGKKSGSSGFFYVKGPELLSKFVGETEATIRGVFNVARAFKARHGIPAVVFIDEADAILNVRGSGRSSDVDRTIVPTFLTEMDGLSENGAIVILATNRHDTIDPAVLREGRIDVKIRITRPKRHDVEQILRLNLRRVPVSKQSDADEMAVKGAEQIFCESRVVLSIKTNKAVRPMTLSQFVSGASVANVVERAAAYAITRDLTRKGKPQGVGLDDLLRAVDAMEEDVRQMDQKQPISEYADLIGEQVSGVKVERKDVAVE